MADLSNLEAARLAAIDPQTSAADLQTIAATYPTLWTEVAGHPRAYRGLLDWLNQVGGPEVKAAVAARAGQPATAEVATPEVTPEPAPYGQARTSVEQPAAATYEAAPYQERQRVQQPSTTIPREDGGRRGPGLVIAVIALAVALVAVTSVLVWQLLKNRESQPPAPSTTSSTQPPATSTGTTTTSPAGTGTSTDPGTQRIVVNGALTGGTGELKPAELAAVQSFADDLADGTIDSIVENCWTYAGADIRGRWASADARQAALASLTQAPSGVQSGIVWGEGQTPPSLAFTTAELASPYACPLPSEFTTAQAALNIERVVGRLKKAPVNPADTEANYPLLTCANNNDECKAIWTAVGSKINADNTVRTGIGPRQTEVLSSVLGKELAFVSPTTLGLPADGGFFVAAGTGTAANVRLVFGTLDGGHYPLLAVFTR